MPEFAASQAADLLRRTGFQANRVCSQGNAISIHDLRVSIRRLTECLRVFGPLLPRDGAKKVRRRLRTAMDLASQVRNHDIAAELLRRAAAPPDSPILQALAAERTEAGHALAAELKRWRNRGVQKKWRARLGV